MPRKKEPVEVPEHGAYNMNTIAEKLRNKRIAISLLEKLHVYQTVSRVWRRHLTASEFTVMMFLIDRSVGWGKNYVRASHGNNLRGNEDYSGVGVSERTYFRCLNSLAAKRMIDRTNLGHSVLIWVNVAWQPAPDYSGAWWQPAELAAE